MEPLWSPVVATGGNQRQIGRARKGRKQSKTVAIRCDRLPREVHGKEGVDGSSPSEGSTKAPHNGGFVSDQLAARTWVGYGALMEPSDRKRRSQGASLTAKRVRAFRTAYG